MGTYGVVRTDNVQATHDGDIKSAKFFNGDAFAQIENGNLVKLEGLIDGASDREMFKAVAPTDKTDKGIYLVANPELIYDETKHYSLSDFVNEAGNPITLIGIKPGDLVSVSDACINAIGSVPAVGNYVTLTVGGTKWTETESLIDETFYGKIIARELYKQGEYLNVIHILSTN